MRIVQLIDSLEAGGAERMAVHYANVLADEIEFSGLVATRKEGPLVQQIGAKVAYLFLDKKKPLDFGALRRLRSFVLQHKVTHVHAHSTSFFLAFLLKLSLPSLKVIRHDHYGNNEFLGSRPIFALKITAPFFAGVIAVNSNLKTWTQTRLKVKNVIYLPNFSQKATHQERYTTLLGKENKRIVCLANLRVQKNHLLLLEVAALLQKTHPDWTFHLVGKDFEDDYAAEIKSKIQELALQNQVFLYGSRTDTAAILQQATIGILTSVSEGLPLSVLEYGMHQLPVVVTAVGALPDMIQHATNGLLVPNNDAAAFTDALTLLIENETLRKEMGVAFYATVQEQFGSNAIVARYLNWLVTL